MVELREIEALGLIVVGNEILDGRRQDKHLAAATALCREWNIELRYALFLPDLPKELEEHLSWAMSQSYPFFCCGGIGATPDDITRQMAAKAAGVALARHPEGLAVLTRHYGDRLTESRLRMIDFPAGSELVSNPVNEVPGFTIRNGYFMPGFPEMAGAMMRQVMESRYRKAPATASLSLTLPGAREADLGELMEEFIAAHPGVSFSSLPQFTPTGTRVVLGVSGRVSEVSAAYEFLKQLLDKAGVEFQYQ